MITRAWSTLTLKKLDEVERFIEGIASTPITDRQDDIVEPTGAKFALPLPLLWQHRAERPIGKVIAAEVSEHGIGIKAIIGRGVAYIDEAWALIERELVRGLSIGFKPLKSEPIEGSDFGRRFKSWEWLELSAVTIAANQDASISSIKAFDLQQMRAVIGTHAPLPVVRLSSHQPADVGANGFVIRTIHPL
jgi:HK97 family phage prohead protease